MQKFIRSLRIKIQMIWKLKKYIENLVTYSFFRLSSLKILDLSNTNLNFIYDIWSGIQTWIDGIEGKCTDH